MGASSWRAGLPQPVYSCHLLILAKLDLLGGLG